VGVEVWRCDARPGRSWFRRHPRRRVDRVSVGVYNARRRSERTVDLLFIPLTDRTPSMVQIPKEMRALRVEHKGEWVDSCQDGPSVPAHLAANTTN
jgi:hypothetical protein